jgi:hypothetical protein
MKIEAKKRLTAAPTLTEKQWRGRVKKLYPKAKFIVEDGTGKTYHLEEKGDVGAFNGPDLQADAVGTFSLANDFCDIFENNDSVEFTPVTAVTASFDLSFDEWKSKVRHTHPKASFVEKHGDITAFVGPKFVAGVYSTHYCWVAGTDANDIEEFGVSASLADPVSNGVAYETLVDGDPSQSKPIVQEVTDNDGGVQEAEENQLLQDDIQVM